MVHEVHKTPLVPLSFSAKFGKKLGSWDKFLLIFPFNKFVAVWGKPVYCIKGEDPTDKKKILEDELNRVTKLADNLAH